MTIGNHNCFTYKFLFFSGMVRHIYFCLTVTYIQVYDWNKLACLIALSEQPLTTVTP